MKQQEVFKKIGGIIKELTEQYKYIETNPENLNDLELELFVANAHFLADHAEILSKLSQRNKTETANESVKVTEIPNAAVAEQTVELKPITAEKFFEPVVQQPKRDLTRGVELDTTTVKKDEEAVAAPAQTYSFTIQEPPIIRHELIVDETDNMEDDLDEEATLDEQETWEEDEPAAVLPVVEPQPVEALTPIEAAPVFTLPKEEVVTINQRISAQLGGKSSITELAGAQPVANLKQAITLNDKLLYIKDLFNGYSLAYSEAIEILNRFNTFEEANRFLNKNYTLKNNWDSKPDTADKFFALLKRRYLS